MPTIYKGPDVVRDGGINPADGLLSDGLLTGFEIVISRCTRRRFNQICPHVDTLTAARVTTAKEQGLLVRAFGIDHRLQIERLFETGADGATVNWPDWIADYQP